MTLLLVELYGRSSHLFGSLLEGNACSGRLHFLSVSVPVRLHRFDVDPGWRSSSSVI